MRQMRLFGMHRQSPLRAFSTTLQAGSITYTNDELIAYLLQSKWDDRHNQKMERLTKAAKFCYKASVEEVRYGPWPRQKPIATFEARGRKIVSSGVPL